MHSSEVVTPYSPGVDDLSAAGVAPPAGRARRVLTPPRYDRGYWWTGLVLFLLAAAFLGLTAIMLFTEAYAFGAGPDGSDVDCQAMSAAIVWGDGIEQVPPGYEDPCRSSAEEDIWLAVGAAALSVACAAGGLLCRRAIRRSPLRAMAETSPTGGQALSLPLGHGWGPARAELTSDALTLVMPTMLSHRWTIPMAEITVVDPDGVEDARAEDVVPATPLTLPQFYVAPAFPAATSRSSSAGPGACHPSASGSWAPASRRAEPGRRPACGLMAWR
jgi:hypothetical protein